MTIAVAIASFRDAALVEACLASVVPQAEAHGARVVVARPASAPVPSPLQDRFPEVRFVTCAEADVPRLRGTAMAHAAADLVAVTEDHCVAAPGWLDALVHARKTSGADVVGGGMGNARRTRAVDWAAYFSEYGFFSWTRPADTRASGVPLLTGANVAYGRPVLADVTNWTLDGTWENVCHDRLHAQGHAIAFAPAARVLQNHTYRFGAFCRDRYEHGRDYAVARLVEHEDGRWRRLAMTPLLPAVLAARVARASAGIAPGAFARALPVTFAFLGAWAVGEAVGYARGRARR
jgi:hypothetical protein